MKNIYIVELRDSFSKCYDICDKDQISRDPLHYSDELCNVSWHLNKYYDDSIYRKIDNQIYFNRKEDAERFEEWYLSEIPNFKETNIASKNIICTQTDFLKSGKTIAYLCDYPVPDDVLQTHLKHRALVEEDIWKISKDANVRGFWRIGSSHLAFENASDGLLMETALEMYKKNRPMSLITATTFRGNFINPTIAVGGYGYSSGVAGAIATGAGGGGGGCVTTVAGGGGVASNYVYSGGSLPTFSFGFGTTSKDKEQENPNKYHASYVDRITKSLMLGDIDLTKTLMGLKRKLKVT